jgi:hypothetical protein
MQLVGSWITERSRICGVKLRNNWGGTFTKIPQNFYQRFTELICLFDLG